MTVTNKYLLQVQFYCYIHRLLVFAVGIKSNYYAASSCYRPFAKLLMSFMAAHSSSKWENSRC
jgi:hypothetical protein